MLRSVLEASEIECFLPDESLLSARPELALALGGARVLVRREDLERASEALTVMADQATQDGESEPGGGDEEDESE